MRNTAITLITLVFLMSVTATAYSMHEFRIGQAQGQAWGKSAVMPMPSSGDLRHHITGAKPYKDWALWPGTKQLYKGKKPHGAFLSTYVNDRALKSIKNKSGMANNSIIVKENYNAEKKLAAITVMYKVKGYNPSDGEWYWVKYAPDFKVIKEGKLKGCISCHGKVRDNDFIYIDKVK